ncbi:MAG: MaoC family dehydratase N-terminal domain-containing protein [Anaerolineae bacterium]|nr:MaoC family dehydratase N-terminal domain-containing protein [Anaerolineae bacterium]
MSVTLEQVNAVVGTRLPSFTYSFTTRDTVIYALGIGAPADWLDPDELRFVYDHSPEFVAIPTMASIYSGELIRYILTGDLQGIKFNPLMLVHGEQQIDIRQPLPTSGEITCQPIISAIYDKGSGMVVVTDVDCRNAAGETVAMTQAAMFIRGLGDFGGDRGPSSKVNLPPDRMPDVIHEESTLTTQALLYRLSGDGNPLHADPSAAAFAGFDMPILHGLATYGFGARAVIKHYCDNNPLRFKKMQARFSRHVFPGETLVTEMWTTDDGVVFQMRVSDRDEVVLSNGLAVVE